MVLWEIERAKELNKPILVIKKERGVELPKALHGYKKRVVLERLKLEPFMDAVSELEEFL